MPNGLAPSFFLSCYLRRPVVWGESARGPTPIRGSRLGGGARSAGVPRGVRGAVRIGCGSQCSRGRDVSGFGATMGLWKVFGLRGGRNRLVVVFALMRVSRTWCHPRGAKAASQMCMFRGVLDNWLGFVPSLGTALLSGCSVGRGIGPQCTRLGMRTNSCGDQTRKASNLRGFSMIHPVLDRMPSVLAWTSTLGPCLVQAPSSVTRLSFACWLSAHVCVYTFRGTCSLEHSPTSPPRAACPQPSLLLLTTIPPPVSWLGDSEMSLVLFPGCSHHRAGLFWRSGSVRISGPARKLGLKPQTLHQGLVIDGAAGPGKPQVGVGWLGGLGFPL